MNNKDVIYEKIALIKKSLSRIRAKTEMKPEKLDDIDNREIFILNLQRAIQSSIDLAAYVISDKSLGLPDTLKEHFSILCDNGIINKELMEKMISMVGFRNIAVHEYQNIKVEILKSILQEELKDFEDFYKTIIECYKSHNEQT